LRTPLRVMAWLQQCGHSPGGLFVCGASSRRGVERRRGRAGCARP
jgi:hypothetical protein